MSLNVQRHLRIVSILYANLELKTKETKNEAVRLCELET